MNAQRHYCTASKADSFGGLVFYLMVLLSINQLIFTGPKAETWLHPCLIVLAGLAIVCSVITTIYQTEGNRLLRATQLSDAFGAAVGEKVRDDYYNNTLPGTARRLGATTLENTLFTKEILMKMVVKERVKNGVYIVIVVIVMVCRQAPTGWVLVLAQTLFSADLVLKWIRLERFRMRTNRVYGQLEQFFLQRGNTDNPNDMALMLCAFTDYECAKDEAVVPLDQKAFEKLNPEVSKQWQEIQHRLNIR